MNTVDNARVCGSLQWVTGRLFETLGGWVERVDDPADVVWLATLSRHLGSHVDVFAEVMPDSVLLAEARAVVPAEPALAAALETVVDTSDPVGVAAALIGRLTTECVEILDKCDHQADGSLRRAVEFLMIDLVSAQANALRVDSKVDEIFRMVTPVV